MNKESIIVEVSDSVYNSLQSWNKLDGIGPAKYALLDQLENVVIKLPSEFKPFSGQVPRK